MNINTIIAFITGSIGFMIIQVIIKFIKFPVDTWTRFKAKLLKLSPVKLFNTIKLRRKLKLLTIFQLRDLEEDLITILTKSKLIYGFKFIDGEFISTLIFELKDNDSNIGGMIIECYKVNRTTVKIHFVAYKDQYEYDLYRLKSTDLTFNITGYNAVRILELF